MGGRWAAPERQRIGTSTTAEGLYRYALYINPVQTSFISFGRTRPEFGRTKPNVHPRSDLGRTLSGFGRRGTLSKFGPNLAEMNPIVVKFDPSRNRINFDEGGPFVFWPNSAQRWSKSAGQFWSTPAHLSDPFWSSSTQFGRSRPSLVTTGPKLIEIGSTLSEIGSSSLEIGPALVEVGPNFANPKPHLADP